MDFEVELVLYLGLVNSKPAASSPVLELNASLISSRACKHTPLFCLLWQEAHFELLSRELEQERRNVAHQLEKVWSICFDFLSEFTQSIDLMGYVVGRWTISTLKKDEGSADKIF